MSAAFVIVAAILGSLAVVGWALLPLRGDAPPLESVDPRFVRLLAEREAALAELRDSDADHADGRLADAAWQTLRSEAVGRAARALEALDALAADRASGVAVAGTWLDSGAEGGVDGVDGAGR